MVMYCIFCGSEQLFTVNSRTTRKNEVWRRRRCESCKKVFTTKEAVDLSHLLVVKKDGRVKKFNKMKIFCGIYNSVRESKNMDRGDAATYAQQLTELVQERLLGVEKKIESRKIAQIVLEVLLDKMPNVFLAYLAYVNRMGQQSQNKHFSKKYWKKVILQATKG